MWIVPTSDWNVLNDSKNCFFFNSSAAPDVSEPDQARKGVINFIVKKRVGGGGLDLI